MTAGYLTLLRFGFYDNTDNRNNGLIMNSMLSVDNNKNNFYQPKGWLPLDTTFTFVALKARAGQYIFCEHATGMFHNKPAASWLDRNHRH